MQRILVIDRDVESIGAVRSVLEAMHFEVEIALQGGTGVEIVTNRRVDLVVLGLDGLEMPGVELMQRVKEARPGIPVIVVAENVEQCRADIELAERVEAFIQKPIDDLVFRESVEAMATRCVS